VNQSIKQNTFSELKIKDLENKLEIARLDSAIAEENYKYHKKEWDFGATYNTYIDNKNKNLKEFEDIRAQEIDLTWFGIGGNLENKSFNLLDSTNNVYNESDLIPSIHASLTRYVNKLLPGITQKRRIWYLTFAGDF